VWELGRLVYFSLVVLFRLFGQPHPTLSPLARSSLYLEVLKSGPGGGAWGLTFSLSLVWASIIVPLDKIEKILEKDFGFVYFQFYLERIATRRWHQKLFKNKRGALRRKWQTDSSLFRWREARLRGVLKVDRQRIRLIASRQKK